MCGITKIRSCESIRVTGWVFGVGGGYSVRMW
jgi:hypothetical protein